MRAMFRFFAVVMLAAIAGGGIAFIDNAPADAQVDTPETRTVALDAGWNLAGWTGPDTPLADAIADIVDVTDAAATFDAVPQSFDTWNASGPDFLNTLDTLLQGQAVWVLVTASIDWVQPVVADPGALALRSGFNLVTWTGPSGLPPADTFDPIAADLDAAFSFDKPTETFASFGPSRPDFLNDLPPLLYGDGFWVLMDAPASWAHPAASPPAQVTGTDIAATLNIPRGALPPGVAPQDISVTDGADDPALPPVSGPDPLLVVQLEPSGLTFPAPATLTTEVALPSGAAPFVLLISDDDVELVTDITLSLNEETGLTTLTVPLLHFSYLDISSDDAVETPEFIDVGSVPVGQSFTVSVPVTRLDFEHERTVSLGSDPENGEILKITRRRPAEGDEEGWQLRHMVFRVISGPLTPPEMHPGDLGAAPGERELVPDAVFTCGEDPGDFAIKFHGLARVNTVVFESIIGSDRVLVGDIAPSFAVTVALFESAIIGTCVAAPAQEVEAEIVTFQLVVMGQSFQLTFHVILPDGSLRPLLQDDTVRSTLTGQAISVSQLQQGDALFALDPNPVRLAGDFIDGGGTCGFAGFQDNVSIFVYQDVVVEIPADSLFEEGAAPADQLLPGVVGFYEGTINADGTGTLTHRHVDSTCEHRWDTTFSNPQPTTLTPPTAPFTP